MEDNGNDDDNENHTNKSFNNINPDQNERVWNKILFSILLIWYISVII